MLKPSSDLPSLQKVVFYKLSPPQMIVTRFGIVPFITAKNHAEMLVSQHGKTHLVLEDKAILGRINVGGLKNALEGTLEIQANLDEFINFLGTYQTIHLDEPLTSDFLIDNNHFPFILVKNTPVSLGTYILTQPTYHWTLMICFGSFILFLGIGLYLFNWHTQKSYRQKIENLETRVLTLKATEESLKATLSKQQRDFEVYKISHQAQKSFHAALGEKHKGQAKHIVGFLEKVKTFPKSIQDDCTGSNNKRMDACLKQAYALSNGLWDPIRKATVDLKYVLKNLYLIFADKLHQSNINLEMEDLPDFPLFNGDSLLIEMFLMNIVGKAIYRAPGNSTVSITAKETLGFVHLQIQDTGYGGILLAEQIIQQSFSLFIEESLLNRLCKENGIYKKYSKSPQGHNITHLVIPSFVDSEKRSSSNVVQLFS